MNPIAPNDTLATSSATVGKFDHKDAVLDHLAQFANVAQFVSFDPDLRQRFAHLHGFPANHRFGGLEDAVTALLETSPEKSVNVRSYTPESPKSREFVYGIRSAHKAAGQVRRLAAAGLYTVVNETIDVNDGGVSGVVFGDLIEFAPGDTPRCVEKPGTAALPRTVGLRMLDKVYGFTAALDFESSQRVEFSIHPLRRGSRREHTVIWEVEYFETPPTAPVVRWPNKFSRMLGDKAFGLLLADVLDLCVPATTVLSRSLPPVHFGNTTGTGETWIRTCPREQVPGKYATRRGWLDPFTLVAKEDPDGDKLASVLAQEGVNAIYSGALLTTEGGEPIVEGVLGQGDEFMQGSQAPMVLPGEIQMSVRALWSDAAAHLGPIRIEWVHDEHRPWVVQLHSGASASIGDQIFPGSPPHYVRFDVARGLESLRELIERINGKAIGVILIGQVGITSHMADLLRKAKIPSRLERHGTI